MFWKCKDIFAMCIISRISRTRVLTFPSHAPEATTRGSWARERVCNGRLNVFCMAWHVIPKCADFQSPTGVTGPESLDSRPLPNMPRLYPPHRAHVPRVRSNQVQRKHITLCRCNYLPPGRAHTRRWSTKGLVDAFSRSTQYFCITGRSKSKMLHSAAAALPDSFAVYPVASTRLSSRV